MSNEELAVRIKAGERDRLLELWVQVKDLVAWYAVRRYNAAPGLGGVEVDDLIQSGFIAMVEAVESFDPGAGYKFSTWMKCPLQTAFAKAGGYLTEKQKMDPLHRCDSLDRPVGEDDGDTLGDLQAAPDDDMEAAEHRIWLEQLRVAMDKAVYDLPGEWPELIDRHYYLGETLQQTADAMGWTRNEVKTQTAKALGKLRRDMNRNGLAWFYEERALDLKTSWFLHVGPEAFASTGTSSVEKIVLQRERDRERPERLTEYVDAVQKSIGWDRVELASLTAPGNEKRQR